MAVAVVLWQWLGPSNAGDHLCFQQSPWDHVFPTIGGVLPATPMDPGNLANIDRLHAPTHWLLLLLLLLCMSVLLAVRMPARAAAHTGAQQRLWPCPDVGQCRDY